MPVTPFQIIGLTAFTAIAMLAAFAFFQEEPFYSSQYQEKDCGRDWRPHRPEEEDEWVPLYESPEPNPLEVSAETRLMEMGFSRVQASAALASCNGNLENALDSLLLLQDTEVAPAVPAKVRTQSVTTDTVPLSDLSSLSDAEFIAKERLAIQARLAALEDFERSTHILSDSDSLAQEYKDRVIEQKNAIRIELETGPSSVAPTAQSSYDEASLMGSSVMSPLNVPTLPSVAPSDAISNTKAAALMESVPFVPTLSAHEGLAGSLNTLPPSALATDPDLGCSYHAPLVPENVSYPMVESQEPVIDMVSLSNASMYKSVQSESPAQVAVVTEPSVIDGSNDEFYQDISIHPQDVEDSLSIVTRSAPSEGWDVVSETL
ncbi:hypothetical protein HDU91_007065 [Kappamyces sp. JEL0680]|nr:hypothetical protein HDU91_007065 [Kappamyces sp. JEL0680]